MEDLTVAPNITENAPEKPFEPKLSCRSGEGYWNDPGTIGTAFSGENIMHLLSGHIENFSLSLHSIQVPSGKTALRPQRKRKYGMSQSLENSPQ